MGEYAEMMLDGTCCQYCGEYLGSDAGYPQSCPSCAEEEAERDDPKTRCKICNKRVKKVGLKDHMRDKHNIIMEQDK